MYQKPSVPRSIGGVLDDTMQLYKASFSRCLVPALLMGVAVALLAIYQTSRIPLSGSSADLQAYLAQGSTASATSSLFSLVGLLLDLVFYSIMIYIIAAVSRGEPQPVGASVAASMRRLPANIGATLLLAIIGIVPFLPLLVAMGGHLSSGATIAQIAARIGPSFLVCLVLLVPITYVLVRMMLYMVPLVGESQGPLRSLAASWRLVGGNWWRTLTLVGVMAIIVYVLTIVILAIAGGIALMVVGIPKGAGQVLGAAAMVAAIVGGGLRIISGPLMAALLVSIYQDLVLRKGGGDLEARLEALPKG
jgi:hypothetical protein